jgi:uncharacterized membrane protein YhaH (DUF805 family)
MSEFDTTMHRRSPFSWFLISTPLNRVTYVIVGFGLAIIKYAIEALAVYLATSQFFSPIDFVNPWLSSKAPFLVDAPGAGVIWLLFTLPFVWIATTMSVRRAADVGISPWFGLAMLIPLVNLAVISLLALLPTGAFQKSQQQLAELEQQRREFASVYGPPPAIEAPTNELLPDDRPPILSLVASIATGCFTQVVVGAISVWMLELYGFVLFFSAPVVAGATAGFVYNHHVRRSIMRTIGMIIMMNFVSFGLMLAIGLDGAICLLLAFPLLGPLSVMGGLVGSAIATASLRPGVSERRGMIGSIILLPMCLSLESLNDGSPLHRVTTSVDIPAPPSVVWQQVIAFPEIESEMAWFFRLGIACPLRARLDGQGVGATRHCEFTTGTFIEPITDWSPPNVLAFDVASQPQPMMEWTPFTHLHPPHLDKGFVSKRGEFRLESIPGGKTRLYGTTWYEIDVRPRLYWKCWADPVIHAIHRRVLVHIAEQSRRASRMTAADIPEADPQ